MKVPEWVKNAIFYQIFPDRFFNGDLSNDPKNVLNWGSKPQVWGFQGGDLQGIIQKLDYLSELGINAIYLNPIFYAASNHRYDTIDYFRIDPKLGTLDDFHQMVEFAHKREIKIVLDGVFNHTGRGFFAFNDILENGEHSAYRNWYHIYHFPVDAYSPGKAKDYSAWWGIKSLPKLNTDHPQVREYIFRVATYWLEQGADGWRLDVPNEIDDQKFWREFRQIVRETKSDAYLLGEIWHQEPHWMENDLFDGLMNYPLRENIIDLMVGKKTVSEFISKLTELTTVYPEENLLAMFNLVGSHDTERIRTALGDDLNLVFLTYLIIFTFIGIPVIFYGDEIGIRGGKEPDSRKAFPWDKQPQRQMIFKKLQKLIQFRRQFSALRAGKYLVLYQNDEKKTFSFARFEDDDFFITVINLSAEMQSISLPLDSFALKSKTCVNNLLGEEIFQINQHDSTVFITIPPSAGYLLH